MTFLRYPHLEKFGNSAVENIEFGVTHIFPKLDGTNSSVWWEPDPDCDGGVCCGSRNREVSREKDNQGFASYVIMNDDAKPWLGYFQKYPSHVLYGEWLVPHTIKHYRDEAWNRFWIFDVYDRETGKFLPYDDYHPVLAKYGLDFIPCIKVIKNGSWENFLHEAKNNRFMLPEDKLGEGIVIKNYDWTNKFQQVTWAKIVNGEFKDEHLIAMGAGTTENVSNATRICDLACTESLIQKEYAKLLNEFSVDGSLPRKFIPRLLHTIFYSVVTEELWDCLKKINYGLVNFKELQQLCIQKTKQTLPDLF